MDNLHAGQMIKMRKVYDLLPALRLSTFGVVD
jgi:hypothetical protein